MLINWNKMSKNKLNSINHFIYFNCKGLNCKNKSHFSHIDSIYYFICKMLLFSSIFQAACLLQKKKIILNVDQVVVNLLNNSIKMPDVNF